MTKLFAAYRRDWEPVLRFFTEQGFAHVRDMINYWLPPGDSITVVNPASSMIEELRPEDIPTIAAMGQGVLRIPPEKLEAYLFSNPYFSVKAVRVLRSRGTTTPFAIGIGIENANYADVRKIDPLAPCFRLGAFGTEGLNTKRVNGMFSFLVCGSRSGPSRRGCRCWRCAEPGDDRWQRHDAGGAVPLGCEAPRGFLQSLLQGAGPLPGGEHLG